MKQPRDRPSSFRHGVGSATSGAITAQLAEGMPAEAASAYFP
jgi:hydroxymethylpyrimidine/phosphomethylpyrimidine kinase